MGRGAKRNRCHADDVLWLQRDHEYWAVALMQIFMLVVFALSIAALVSLALWIGRNVFGIENTAVFEGPAEILRLRFAKGEITREQFDEMRLALESKPVPAT